MGGERVGDGRPVHLVTTASPEHGGGHVSRQLSLAEGLVARGARVSIEVLEAGLGGRAAERAARLGVTGARPRDAIVVVDLPEAGQAVRWGPPERLVVFDDRDGFAGRAAVVVQPSMPSWRGTGRADRVLAGYDYAPVAQRFRRLAEDTGSIPRAGHRPDDRLDVLACFGGSDPAGVTERIGGALSGADRWTATAIVGALHAGAASLAITVERDPPDLAERLAACDIAVLGAGTMKLEAACLGRPMIIMAVADDQLVVGPPFAETGAAIWLGDGRSVAAGVVRRAIDDLAADPGRRDALARRAHELVDGHGVDRLSEAILELDA